MKQPHGVGAAADTGDRRVGQPSLGFLQLRFGFLADHRLKVAHHHRIGMRAGDGADEIIGVLDIGDPVAHRLVHRVLQRAGAGGHRHHSAPSSFMRNTLGFCRSTSAAPM